MTGGIGYFKFLEDCAKNFDEKKSEIIAGLKRVMEALFTRENMTVSYTADDEGFSYLGNAMRSFRRAAEKSIRLRHRRRI